MPQFNFDTRSVIRPEDVPAPDPFPLTSTRSDAAKAVKDAHEDLVARYAQRRAAGQTERDAIEALRIAGAAWVLASR